jgi:hypothetical protein
VDANGDGTTFATLDNPLPSQVILNAAPSPNGRDMYALVTDTSSGDSEIFEISGPQLDTTAPAIDCGAADGQWHADNVTISCTASDSGSGLADASDASFTLSTSVASGVETADAATGTRQVCDLAGNCATAGPIDGNMIDRKAPAVTCGSADGLWHNDNVTIACTASDGGSGISAADASFGLSTSVAPGSATANASTGTRSVCDAVGNCATAGPIGGNMIDRSPPVLHLPANIVTGQRSVTYTATATDDDDPSPALTCSPASGSTFPFGTTLVACKATDHAGNATTGGFSITVDPLLTLTNAVAAIGRANLKAHVKNLAQVGGNGYCSQLKVIAGELADVSPVTQAVLDGEAAVAALQRASGCSR